MMDEKTIFFSNLNNLINRLNTETMQVEQKLCTRQNFKDYINTEVPNIYDYYYHGEILVIPTNDEGHINWDKHLSLNGHLISFNCKYLLLFNYSINESLIIAEPLRLDQLDYVKNTIHLVEKY